MKYYISILLLSISGFTFSQVKLEGYVKDSIGNPLELANVIAINKATSALDSYGITNDDGKYRLDLKKNTTYSIQVSYIGMKSMTQTFDSGESNVTQNFTCLKL